MTRSHATKQAFILSVLSLITCIAMLVGSTMAWFTDSVSSATNKIVAGNLALSLEYKNSWSNTWSTVDASTKLFDENARYEPGYTEIVYLRVANAGSLTFKYQLMANIVGEDSSYNVNGEEFYISDHLKLGSYSIKEFGRENAEDVIPAKFGSRENAISSVELKPLKTAVGNLIDERVIVPGDKTSDIIVLVLTMPLDVSNDANHAPDVDAPSVDLGLSVVATQFEFESDSFGSDYDADVDYPRAYDSFVTAETTYAEFCDMLANGGDILLAEDIDFSEQAHLAINGDVSIYAGSGTEISFDEVVILSGSGKLSIYGGAIQEAQEFYVGDNVTFEINGGEHTFAALSVGDNAKIVINGGTVNCLGSYSSVLGIAFDEYGQLYVNGGTLNLSQPINLNRNLSDGAYVEINGGAINLKETTDKLFVVRNVMAKDTEAGGVLRGSSIKITGGVFTALFALDDTGGANAFIRNEDTPHDTTKVLVSNTYNGEPDYSCVVTGGTFYGDWKRTGETGDELPVAENTIAGFVADGYQMTGDAVNGYVVSAN